MNTDESLAAQNTYLTAFAALKSGNYYAAWCAFEKLEIELNSIERHETESWVDFRLDFIRAYTAKWQSLFPYRVFLSPEMVVLERQCSVCHEPRRPRTPCGHEMGEIYDGEECYSIVTKLEVLGVALVDRPVQPVSQNLRRL